MFIIITIINIILKISQTFIIICNFLQKSLKIRYDIILKKISLNVRCFINDTNCIIIVLNIIVL